MKTKLIIEKQAEIIAFYGKIINDNAMFLHIYHVDSSKEEIETGQRLRSELAQLQEEAKEISADSVFAFKYNPMIYESGYITVSLHKTRKGAEMAMDFHKEEKRKDWLVIYPTEEDQTDSPFGVFEDWKISEIEVK